MRGDLRRTSLSALLRQLYAGRKSGVLHLARQNDGKRLFLRNGVTVFVDEGASSPGTDRARSQAIARSIFSWTTGAYAFQEMEPRSENNRKAKFYAITRAGRRHHPSGSTPSPERVDGSSRPRPRTGSESRESWHAFSPKSAEMWTKSRVLDLAFPGHVGPASSG